eukprot:CAMPEP_0181327446 /NCGR_PEP_ID=MMETSP1101-20121128/22107_1 /TAXON_ID=46948 /ORGANISM="Rhodomonas abbreviata, Strain Caron Lab Isolate" /LENGTH=96 /DNA_ID=CAMNT_0023436109 /DNA_START=86 /DNA_END=376 /DNA_ORIENTATION=+
MPQKAVFPALSFLALIGSALASFRADDCKDFPEVLASQDDEHYCNFLYTETYSEVSWAGAVALAIFVVIVAVVVVLRDIMNVWDCGGVTKEKPPTT